jgi:hypothetical protein
VTFGNGLFVAVASNGTSRIMTSQDGITWTLHSFESSDSNQWWDVTFGNGLFCRGTVYEIGTGTTHRDLPGRHDLDFT